MKRESAKEMGYAIKDSTAFGGFFRRFLSHIIDYLVKLIIAVLFAFFCILVLVDIQITSILFDIKTDVEFSDGLQEFIILSGAFLIEWIYEAVLTSSSWQATIGKRILGLKVVDGEGNRISFARATGRFLAKILSGLILCIGFLMIVWTKRKRGLHDMIAETLVIKV